MTIAELRAFERGKVHPIAHARRREVQAWLASLDRRLDPLTIAAAATAKATMPDFDRQTAERRKKMRERAPT